jgi:hypothetical protein
MPDKFAARAFGLKAVLKIECVRLPKVEKAFVISERLNGQIFDLHQAMTEYF